MKYFNKDLQFYVSHDNEKYVVESFDIYGENFKDQDSFSFGVDTPLTLSLQEKSFKCQNFTLFFKDKELFDSFNTNYYLKDKVDNSQKEDTPPVETSDVFVEETGGSYE